jgi:hypothetical protein
MRGLFLEVFDTEIGELLLPRGLGLADAEVGELRG